MRRSNSTSTVWPLASVVLCHDFGGGGGGGGYSGGGGAGDPGHGGGGGSFNAGSNPTNTAGTRVGDGFATITFTIAGTVNADPHFAGANGAKFDFGGQPNGIYSLFSAPQFQINMRLAADGPKERFVTEVGVLFRNLTMRFGVVRYRQTFVDQLNQRLAPFDARVDYNGWKTTLQLCQGHEIIISQMHTNNKRLSHPDGSPFFYLDVEVRAPHCDDAFDGRPNIPVQICRTEGAIRV